MDPKQNQQSHGPRPVTSVSPMSRDIPRDGQRFSDVNRPQVQSTLRQSPYITDFVPRNPDGTPSTAPVVSSNYQTAQPTSNSIPKPLLQPQYQPKIPHKSTPSSDSAMSAISSDSNSISDKGKEDEAPTKIAFHVPGERPEPHVAASKEPAITTFDRNALPPVAAHSSNPTGKRGQGLRDTLSIVGVLASALVLAFCLITFVFQSYQVDGPSMQTTLQNSDHLIVWKVQRTFADITHHAYIPNRGDVIVFSEPGLSDYGQDSGKQLIKRVTVSYTHLRRRRC